VARRRGLRSPSEHLLQAIENFGLLRAVSHIDEGKSSTNHPWLVQLQTNKHKSTSSDSDLVQVPSLNH